MKIQPEVSQIDTDPSHSVSVASGVSVPALIVRRASTTVELRDGQSFIIGGLLQTNNRHSIDQLPWLGSVPVLGTLFSSKSYQQTRLTSSSSSRRIWCAERPATSSGRPPTTPAAERPGFLPARQGRGHARRGQGADAAIGAHRRRRSRVLHRPHARYAEGGLRCGHPLTRCACSRSRLSFAALSAVRNISTGATPLRSAAATRSPPTRPARWSIPGRATAPTATSRYNGQKMQIAVERYRTNKVIPPQGIGTSTQLSAAASRRQNTPRRSGPTAPAAPVK